MKLGICQIKSIADKKSNLTNAEKAINQLVTQDVNIILLPECFNSPYGIQYFKDNAEYFEENEKNITFNFFVRISKKFNKIYFFFGSIPEIDNQQIYNTMAIFYQGIMLNKYRKIHLYDIDIPGKHSFSESKVLSPGKKPIIIETPWGKIGVGICFDLRFTKLAEYYRKNGCVLILYPGSFNLLTGNDHWELLQRSKALDNMLFIATCSTARNDEAEFKSWGNSMVVNPWGKVLNKLDEKENNLIVEININEIYETRRIFPTFENQKCF